VIEIDGDTHAAPDQAAYDSARTAWLEERGFDVIRFQAGEVDRNLEARCYKDAYAETPEGPP